MRKTLAFCRFPLRWWLLGALLMGAFQPAGATIMKYLEIEELARLSTDVFHGQVLAAQPYWDENHKNVFTEVRVRLLESFKGAAKRGAVVTLKQWGGELDGLRFDYAGRPHFQPGEQVVLFTKPGLNRALLVVGLQQGKLRVAGAEAVRDFAGLTLLQAPAGRGAKAAPPARLQTRLSLRELRQRIANAH